MTAAPDRNWLSPGQLADRLEVGDYQKGLKVLVVGSSLSMFRHCCLGVLAAEAGCELHDMKQAIFLLHDSATGFGSVLGEGPDWLTIHSTELDDLMGLTSESLASALRGVVLGETRNVEWNLAGLNDRADNWTLVCEYLRLIQKHLDNQ